MVILYKVIKLGLMLDFYRLKVKKNFNFFLIVYQESHQAD